MSFTGKIIEKIPTISQEILDNRYNKTKLLGKGVNGEVYLAYDTIEKKDIAVKIVAFTGFLNKYKNILNDIRDFTVNKKLNNAHLVKYYDIYRLDDKVVITMEYVKGWELDKAFIFKKLKLVGIPFWKVASQLLEVTKYLKRMNVRHNDIHGGNIMITRDAHLYLIDYGWMCNVKATNFTKCGKKSPTGKEDEKAVAQILYDLHFGDSFLGYSKIAKLNAYLNNEVKFKSKTIGEETEDECKSVERFLTKLYNEEYTFGQALAITEHKLEILT